MRRNITANLLDDNHGDQAAALRIGDAARLLSEKPDAEEFFDAFLSGAHSAVVPEFGYRHGVADGRRGTGRLHGRVLICDCQAEGTYVLLPADTRMHDDPGADTHPSAVYFPDEPGLDRQVCRHHNSVYGLRVRHVYAAAVYARHFEGIYRCGVNRRLRTVQDICEDRHAAVEAGTRRRRDFHLYGQLELPALADDSYEIGQHEDADRRVGNDTRTI